MFSLCISLTAWSLYTLIHTILILNRTTETLNNFYLYWLHMTWVTLLFAHEWLSRWQQHAAVLWPSHGCNIGPLCTQRQIIFVPYFLLSFSPCLSACLSVFIVKVLFWDSLCMSREIFSESNLTFADWRLCYESWERD